MVAPAAAWLFVDAKKHGEGHNEIYGVEGRANRVSVLSVLEGVIWEVGDGECFHEGGNVSQHKNNKSGDCREGSGRPCHESTAQTTEDKVGHGVIEDEVGMGHEVAGDGNIVDAPF